MQFSVTLITHRVNSLKEAGFFKVSVGQALGAHGDRRGRVYTREDGGEDKGEGVREDFKWKWWAEPTLPGSPLFSFR